MLRQPWHVLWLFSVGQDLGSRNSTCQSVKGVPKVLGLGGSLLKPFENITVIRKGAGVASAMVAIACGCTWLELDARATSR